MSDLIVLVRENAGPAPASNSHRPEGRRSQRRPFHQTTRCQFAPEEGRQVWWAKVLDLSLGGMGLLADRRLEPNTALQIALAQLNSGSVYVLTARVIHCREQSPSQFILGCAFLQELRSDELQILLRDCLRT